MNFLKRILKAFKSERHRYYMVYGKGVTMDLDAPMHISDKMPTEPAMPPNRKTKYLPTIEKLSSSMPKHTWYDNAGDLSSAWIYVTDMSREPEKGGDLD